MTNLCLSGLFSIRGEVLFGAKVVHHSHAHICIKMHIPSIDLVL